MEVKKNRMKFKYPWLCGLFTILSMVCFYFTDRLGAVSFLLGMVFAFISYGLMKWD